MTVYFYTGHVIDKLKELPENSIQCCVTSPPYFGLRRYLPDGHDHAAYEIGGEPTLAEYITNLVEVFREVRRVLRPDGVCFLNLGDSYATGSGGYGTSSAKRQSNRGTQFAPRGVSPGLKPKDLMMVPARVAIALQDDGWYLRSHIIWHKKAPMPESVTDRPTSAHESIFLLTKSARYFWDQEAVREPYDGPMYEGRDNGAILNGDRGDRGRTIGMTNPNGRNLRNVWTLGPEPFPGAHFATMPTEIPVRCIKAGTSERGCCAACGAPWVRVVDKTNQRLSDDYDKRPLTPKMSQPLAGRNDFGGKTGLSKPGWRELPPAEYKTTGWRPGCACDAGVVPCKVLDPFLGSGTTALVADVLGRDCIGIDLNQNYINIAKERIYNEKQRTKVRKRAGAA